MQSIPSSVAAFVESASKGAGAESPFWYSDSEEAREEGMYQLAFELDVNAAVWYARLSMPEEAKALRAMLSQYMKTPENYEDVDAAYESSANPYLEGWDRIPRVVTVLCVRAEELFYEQA